MRCLEMVAGSSIEGLAASQPDGASVALGRAGVQAGLLARSRAAIMAGFLGGLALAPAALVAQDAALPPVATKADPAKGEKIAGQVCAACHGPDGNSTAPSNPKIAAQHPTYLQKQLADFKVKEGAKTASRPSPIMTPLASQLSPQDMADLAAFYSAKPLKPSAARNKEMVDLGREIYRGGIADKGVPSCSGCHGPTGSGIPAQFPRLAGQYSDYTEAQLVAFRSGTRQNNLPMSHIASRLSDSEIKALADYIAGLR
jgi:cytochrome c553